MRHPFQKFVEELVIDTDSEEILTEAVLCHRVGAYRGALLLSFMGFLSILRTRLIRADRPAGIEPASWKSIQRKVYDDLEWERSVLNAIRRKKDPVFLIDDDLREQVSYWRRRRNDIAHSRSNAVGLSHLESFWLFLRSNIGKFQVKDSEGSLLKRFQRHYSPRYTPPDSDLARLVGEISRVLDPQSYASFVRKILRMAETSTRRRSATNNSVIDFVDEVMALANEDQELLRAVLDGVTERDERTLRLLCARPRYTSYIDLIDFDLERFCYEVLLEGFGELPWTRPPDRDFFSILATIKRNKIIGEDRYEALLDSFVMRLFESPGSGITATQDLIDIGILGSIERICFSMNEDGGLEVNTKWIRDNSYLFFEFIKNKDMDGHIAAALSELYRPSPDEDEPFRKFGVSPEATPYLLGYFKEDSQALAEVRESAEAEGVGLEPFLSALEEWSRIHPR